jgi:hypothetical protein
MRVNYVAKLFVIVVCLFYIFPNESYSQMTLTTECKVKIADSERGTLHGKGFLYGGPNKKAKIVVKWETGSVLNFNGTSNGDRAKGTWKNGNNTGTMSIERTSHTTFEGPLVWQNNTNTIYFYDCETVYGRNGGNQTTPTIGVFFHNTKTIPLTVFVNETDGPLPPDPTQSTVVFSGPPTFTRNSAAGLTLAYGCYSFCVHWDTGKTDDLNQKIYAYRFIGDLPNEPAICLNENSTKPVVKVSSGIPFAIGVGYAGQCPGAKQAVQPVTPTYPEQQAPLPRQQESSLNLPPCDCTNPRNGKRFLLPTLIIGACTDETVLDYLRPENYNCR